MSELRHWIPQAAESENHISKSEEPFFRLFYAASNPMAITTINEGRIIDLNHAFSRIAGYSREELIGKTTVEYRIWLDSAERNKVIRKLQKEGKVHNLEVRMRTKNGDIRTILFSIDKITLDCEPYLLSTAVDITEQKNAGKELRESEEKYRTLVEQSLQGLAIIQDKHFVFCNSKFAEITGYSIKELLSLSSGEITAMIHPENRAFIGGFLYGQIGQKPIPTRYEFRGIKKDGTEVWLEIYSSLIEYRGKPAIQSVFLDITERKRAVENLAKALDRYEAIFEGSRDAVIISDANYKFVEVNEAACRLLGYSKEELLNMRAVDLNKAQDPSLLDNLHTLILQGEDVLGETQIFAKDGREIDVEFGHRRIIIAGEPYIHSIARDISKRKRLEAQFQQAQKMEAIGVLAGGVAHDFNNLLNVINGYSELALEALASDSPARADIEQVLKAGQQAASLTSQLLAFSRKQILKPEIMNLNDTVAEMSTMLRRLIGEDIKLAAVTQHNLGFVNADPAQVQQVIMNLAVNARDAMPQGGKLTIETSNVEFDDDYIRDHAGAKAGPYVMLAISDSGIGMDEDTQARIFEPFFTTKGKGTGLGLSTIYGIVKQNNGFIWVYSEPGKGTTFKVYFPRVPLETAAVPAESKSRPEFCGDETVLIVEDDASVLDLASRILKKQGYTIFRASNADEGLETARKYAEKIHLVIADVVMPKMGGKELVSQLETDRPDIKALYTSGYTDRAIVHHGILESNVAFLQKPFTVESLIRKVREVIDS